MGVKGLWELISPVARTVKLESLNNKRLAIDASIWLYQFLTAMRDKEGNRLKNAHLLGFFRRICKLLFYNIKPVFVFDGGAPELKRITLNERRMRRVGNANNLQKTAEKLLSAQLRLHTIQESEESNAKKIKKSRNKVYFDELKMNSDELRRKKCDEYDLPPISGGIKSMVTKGDPRLATEDDLRNFVREFKPEEIDIDSEAFRSLPLETQYEVIGELRIKSRQTSWDRFQEMVKNAPTAMDFSQLQIKYLVNRNDLTQKLINVTNNATNQNNATPIRIASERNKKYVLVKNKEGIAGWTMGSVDENKSKNNNYGSSTSEKLVYMECSDNDKSASVNEEDSEFEELRSPKSALPPNNYKNQDFEDYMSSSSDNRDNLLLDENAYAEDNESIESVIEKFKRLESEQLVMSSSKINNDSLLSINHDNTSMESDSFYALWLSRMLPAFQKEYNDHDDMLYKAIYVWSEDELEEQKRSVIKKLGKLKECDVQKISALNFWQGFLTATVEFRRIKSDVDDQSRNLFDQQDLKIEALNSPIDPEEQKNKKIYTIKANPSIQKAARTIKKLNIDFESLVLPVNHMSSYHTSTFDMSKETATETSDFEEVELPTNSDADHQPTNDDSHTINSPLSVQTPNAQKVYSDMDIDESINGEFFDREYESRTNVLINNDALEKVHNLKNLNEASKEGHIEILSDEHEESKYVIKLAESVVDNSDEGMKQLSEEESEFARFLSELKKKDLDSVQQELNIEVQHLNEQRRREKRDADSVTETMISECQKLLQLFGIPYITAPMEAEAQCAKLLHLELVDGIVTDDSDVFLFGGSRIYKNMFSQQKYVECYISQDLEQNMRLNREKLINLAMLLGSDYTEGLTGVGVVSAMEILNEFPGEKGLEHFRDWWLEVQNGASKPDNDDSDFKKKFRKKMKNLIMPKSFPNHHVWDAYIRPEVDDSKIQFQWAMPNLDDLRDFLMDNFLWSYEKVDETLVPLMKTLTKRQSEEANQTVLNNLFDLSIGNNTVYKPHKSKRIQCIVDSWKHRETENQSNDDRRQKKRHHESSNNLDLEKSSNKKRKKRQ